MTGTRSTNRRKFLQTAAVAASSSILLTACDSGATAPALPAFVHHVFFWLKNPENTAEHNQLLAALRGLQEIKEIRLAHLGSPSVNDFDRPVTDATYSFSVLLLFASKADEEAYLVHPLHKAFIDNNKHLWSKVVVYDSLGI